MTTSSRTVTFHYDENNHVAFETDENNQVIASYTFEGDHPVSMTRGGKTYYYQLNGHGDVVTLTDSTGVKVATYEYGPYGDLVKKTGSVENSYLYAGYRCDEETGFYYLQSRYYDPRTGRFLTRDTFEGEERVPLSQNRYAYGHNNPVINTDPTGHFIPAIVVVALKLVFDLFLELAIQSFIITAFDFSWKFGWKFWKWNRSSFISAWKSNFLHCLIPFHYVSKRIKLVVRFLGSKSMSSVINLLKYLGSILLSGVKMLHSSIGRIINSVSSRARTIWNQQIKNWSRKR
jgi:RHS repeat-associated protein